MIESVTGEYFSLVLAQSRQCWAQILAKGGSALTLKTQRYEGDDRVVLEIGWSLLQYKEVNGQMMEREDVQHISGLPLSPCTHYPHASTCHSSS